MKYLTRNVQVVVEHLLCNKSKEERDHFRALLETAVQLVYKNEEHDCFEPGSKDELSTEVVAEYDDERDIFYSKQVPKSALVRFMQVVLENSRKCKDKLEDLSGLFPSSILPCKAEPQAS